ncbi:hemin receptor [Mycetocola tolaasinivorans]|uniref:Hemin receptor n=1 Tax=Mycetocola tolaasinivorans TaxID=76635 RepID=A0A3L7A315_9MICO|nr:ABC transporter substrate-binding protein [Mycetocola tolaasinivorans]RLP74587.1 hemin receptor [Mycetocola tolaasinivorans]
MSPRGNRVRAAALLTLCTLLLAGCSATATTGNEGDCPTTPLSELKLDTPANQITGVSAACLSNPAIEPIATDPKPVLPVTVTDDAGTEVTVKDASRILAIDISGTLAATVWGLGLGKNLIGRDAATKFPGTEKLPLATGSSHTLNAEAILAMAPTVILTDGSLGPKAVREQLADSGIPVVKITQDRTIANTGDIVREVSTALGVADTGTKLTERIDAELKTSLADIQKIVPADETKRPRVIFLYARGGAGIYYLFGEGSGADSLIDAIGGVDVAKEIGWNGMKPMTAEALMNAKPDVLLMMTDGLKSVNGVDGLLEQIPALASTPAGEHRRVVTMDDTEILGFGPRTPAVVESLARALYTAPEPSATPAK